MSLGILGDPRFIIAVLVIFPILAAWMTAAGAFVGTVLRAAHEEVAFQRTFVLLKRYGLWRSLPSCWRSMRRRASEGSGERPIATLTTIAVVPMVGFMAPIILPYMLMVLLMNQADQQRMSDQFGSVVFLLGLLGAVLASVIWYRGVKYAADPRRPRSKTLPRLAIPREVSSDGKIRIAVSIYWRAQIRTLMLVSSLYPWLLVSMMAATLADEQPSPNPPALAADPPLIANIAVMLATVLPAYVAARTVANAVYRRFEFEPAIEALLECLEPPEDDGDKRPGNNASELAVDPLGPNRARLATAIDRLERSASGLDVQPSQNRSPHPIATLIRGTARTLRNYARSSRSLHKSLPADIVETIELTVAVVAGPRDVRAYERLAARVSAFDADGQPAIEDDDRPPRRFALLPSRIADGVERTARMVHSLAAMIAVVLAVALFFLGRLGALDGLLPHLK